MLRGKGYCWDKARNRWIVYVYDADGKRKFLGRYKTEDEAGAARDDYYGIQVEPPDSAYWFLAHPDIGPSMEWYHELHDYKLPSFPVAETKPAEEKETPRAVSSLTELSIGW
jgi:hypothetical protein